MGFFHKQVILAGVLYKNLKFYMSMHFFNFHVLELIIINKW